MAATKQDISSWLDRGVKEGATHMIVVCDTYDYDDYPKYVSGSADFVHRKVAEVNAQSMQRVMEVYNLSVSKVSQLAEHRAFNF